MIGGFPPPAGTKEERKLTSVFKSLNAENKQTLLKFAEFLASQPDDSASNALGDDAQATPEEVITPRNIERPEEESVIKGIKRLNKTYPMLDKSTLLDKTSSLMTDHIMKGREASAVIDELEVFFKEQYEKLQASQ